ncbi:MAG: hypothetical protein R6X32_17685 [Chloroflexota bacterium]|jgi:hypothetical protein
MKRNDLIELLQDGEKIVRTSRAVLLSQTADFGRLYLTNRRLFFRRYADTSPWVQLVTGLFAGGFFVVIAFSDATAVVPASWLLTVIALLMAAVILIWSVYSYVTYQPQLPSLELPLSQMVALGRRRVVRSENVLAVKTAADEQFDFMLTRHFREWVDAIDQALAENGQQLELERLVARELPQWRVTSQRTGTPTLEKPE